MVKRVRQKIFLAVLIAASCVRPVAAMQDFDLDGLDPEMVQQLAQQVAAGNLDQVQQQAAAAGVDLDQVRQQATAAGVNLNQVLQAVGMNMPEAQPQVAAKKPNGAKQQKKSAKKSANDQEEIDPELLEEIGKAVQEAQDTMDALEDGIDIDEILEEGERLRNEINEKKRESIKKKNAVLFRKELFSNRYDEKISLGFFKNDIYRFGLICGDYVMDYFFHKKIRFERVKHISDKIIEDPQGLLALLEEIGDDPDAMEELEEEQERSFLGKFRRVFTGFFSREHPKIKALKDYLKNQHSFIGYNPFKKEVLLSAATRFGCQEASYRIQKYLESYDENFLIEENLSYVKNEKGELEALPGEFVISSASAFNFLRSPVTTTYDFVTSRGGMPLRFIISLMNTRLGYNPPEFLFSWWFKLMFRVFAFGGAIKIFDKFCHDMWTDYILTNRDELLGLLEEYQEIQREGTYDEIDAAKERLTEFVRKGHDKAASFLPIKNFGGWLLAHKGARAIRTALVASVILIPFAWKTGCFIRDNWEFLTDHDV